MTWLAIPTFTSGNVLTAAQMNILGGNLAETSPSLATATGFYPVANGANSLAMREAESDVTDAAQTTTSTSYTDLATVGPSVSVTTGASAAIHLYSYLYNSTAGARALTTFVVSGATTSATNDNRALYIESTTAPVAITVGASFLLGGMTPGTSTVKMQYKVGGGGTGTFDHRRIWVHPY